MRAWTIERGDASVFLFGVRPGPRDTAWVTDRIDAAMAGSDEFWRETPPEDEFMSSPLIAELALSLDVPLSERLDESTHRRLSTVAKNLGIDTSALESLRPAAAAQVVQEQTLLRADIPPEQNMDVVLTRLAEGHNTAVRYEFTVEGALRTFLELPQPLELDYLRFILDAAEAGRELIDAGFSAWSRGDSSIDELGDADWRMRYPALYEPLIRQRNLAWIPRIDEMLGRPGTRFVAVGCSHLAGPDSIVSLLEPLDCRIAAVGTKEPATGVTESSFNERIE